MCSLGLPPCVVIVMLTSTGKRLQTDGAHSIVNEKGRRQKATRPTGRAIATTGTMNAQYAQPP